MKTTIALVMLLLASPAFADMGDACKPIFDACMKAGFKAGAGGEGLGLSADCIEPIMKGTKQPKTAKAKLPKVSKAQVTKCHKGSPDFGFPPKAPPSPSPAAK